MTIDPLKLAAEYRPSMSADILHLWAKEVVVVLTKIGTETMMLH